MLKAILRFHLIKELVTITMEAARFGNESKANKVMFGKAVELCHSERGRSFVIKL